MNEILHEKQVTKQVDFVQTAHFLFAQRSVLRRKGIQANKIHLFCHLFSVQYFVHAFVLLVMRRKDREMPQNFALRLICGHHPTADINDYDSFIVQSPSRAGV